MNPANHHLAGLNPVEGIVSDEYLKRRPETMGGKPINT